jgi:hypothetical protein
MLRSVLLAAVVCAAGVMLSVGAADAAGAKCVKKAGEGWGITKEIAEFQSYEIIQQVTGNWPFESDKISKPVYKCKGTDGDWTCVARATVCSKT